MPDQFDPVPACFSGVQFLPIPRLERIVSAKLQKYNRITGQPIALPIAIEDCIEIVEKIPVEAFEGNDRFPIDVLGAYDFREQIMYVREDISNLGRRRFTQAHEYGHYVLHSGHYLQAVFDFYSELESNPIQLYRGDNSTRNKLEWQANKFASHFLMPTQLLMDEWGLKRSSMTAEVLQAELSERAQVSCQAAGIRLRELKWIE